MPIMENSKHTPGPWKIMPDPRQRSGDWARWTLLSEKGSLLTFTGVDQKGDEGAANARLIAAAPYLLEALKSAVLSWEGSRNPPSEWEQPAWYIEALAAIAKAETV